MYANDIMAMKEADRRRGLKQIDEHTDQELNMAIANAMARFGHDFWLMLHGIDAYMERRSRHRTRWAVARLTKDIQLANEAIGDPWGNS